MKEGWEKKMKENPKLFGKRGEFFYILDPIWEDILNYPVGFFSKLPTRKIKLTSKARQQTRSEKFIIINCYMDSLHYIINWSEDSYNFKVQSRICNIRTRHVKGKSKLPA